MKISKLIVIFFAVLSLFVSCSKDNDLDPLVDNSENVVLIKNLYAPHKKYDENGGSVIVNKEFVKFSFKEGKIVASDDWDIAFRGIEIIVNGGEARLPEEEPARTGNVALAVIRESFDEINTISDDLNFKQDNEFELAIPTGDKVGWYTYDVKVHIVSPIAGKNIIVRTHDNHYVKMEILSHYKNGEDNDMYNHSYYTFKYVYNKNENEKTF